MAELLSKWINQDVGLSIPVQSFERDFSNGYYFGELLVRLQLLPEESFITSFVNNNHPHTLTANLGVLSSLLKNMGIPFDARLAKDITSQTAGASLRLLYAIKMAVQKREQQQSGIAHGTALSKTFTQSFTKGGKSGFPPVAGASERPASSLTAFHPSGANPLPPSVVSPQGHKAARPLDRVENRRLADNLLKITHQNSKERTMAARLERFEIRGAAQEEKAREDERADDEARLDYLRHKQAEEREKLQNNQAFQRTWNASGMQVWRSNMERIDATKAARKNWNQTVAVQQTQTKQLRTAEKVYEMKSGIDEFEKNLERIGAGGSSVAAGADDSQAHADDPAYQESTEVSAIQHINSRLATTLGSPAQRAKQSAEHLDRIADKVANDAVARKERERRRRKVLVEQSAQAAALDLKRSEELFLEKVKRESAEERALGEEIWRTSQYYDILKQNAEYRSQQEIRVREEREAALNARNQSLYESTKKEHERQLASELQRFEEIRLLAAQESHAENVVYARNLVGRLVDVAFKAASFREVSEQALVPPPMWREWMQLFVTGKELLPAASATPAYASPFDSIMAGVTGQGSASAAPTEGVTAGSASNSASNLRLEAALPTELLAALSLGDRSSAVPSSAAALKSPAAKGKDAKSIAAAQAAAELDAQSLSMETFYESLHHNRSVSNLMRNIRDLNEDNADLIDEVTLEDYLHGRNEWSYDVKHVAPPELVNDRAGELPIANTTGSAAGETSTSPSAAASPVASRKSLEDAASGKAMSKKAKEAAAAAAAAAAAESEPIPYTSLSFLGPLHTADTYNLSEPFSTASEEDSAAVASAVVAEAPANQNTLFGALLQRVLDVASGKEQPPDLPEVPKFPLSLVLLGKPFSGKQTQSALLSEKFGLKVFKIDQLVKEGLEQLDALESVQAAEKISARAAKKDGINSGRRSAQGKAAAKSPFQLQLVKLKKLMVKSDPIPDEILVALVVEAIKNLPGEVASKKETRDTLAAIQASQKAREESEAADAFASEEEKNDMVEFDGGEASVSAVAASLEPEPVVPLIPGEGGYILLNFPTTLSQAKLLEQSLSGFELPKAPSAKSTGVPKLAKNKKDKLGSKLSAAPTPAPFEGPYPSAFDLVFRFDLDNDTLLRRALGERIDPLTGKKFHLDYKQPTEADMNASVVPKTTPSGKSSRTEASELKARLKPDPTNADYHANLPELFLQYDKEEPSLTEWFNLFGTLRVIAGSQRDVLDTSAQGGSATAKVEFVGIESIREEIRSIVRAKMQEIDEKKAADAIAAEESARALSLTSGEVSLIPQSDIEKRALDEAATSVPPQPVSEEVSPIVPVPTPSSKKKDASALEAELPPPPQYVYPIFDAPTLFSFSQSGFYDAPLASFLTKKWTRCEENFLYYSRHVFRALRALRSTNLEYFASTRRNFFAFLRRADSKQALLDDFQKAFNNIPQDLRSDVATKEELHLRLDELGDQLWKLNNSKHEENENEFNKIAGTSNPSGSGVNEFVEKQLEAFFFYYALLMQLELDRYFQTIKIAQDFFSSTKGLVLYDEKERDEKEAKKAASSVPKGEEGKNGEPIGVAIRGGLGVKLHINLPLTLAQARDPSKKGSGSNKKKDTSAAGSAKDSAASSQASLKESGNKKGSRGSLGSARGKRYQAPVDGEDPFAELVEIIRRNFIDAQEAVEQINAGADLESLVASAGQNAPGTTARGGKKQIKTPSSRGKDNGSSIPPTSPSGRSSSAKKRASSKGLLGTPQQPERVIVKPTRDSLLDAQLRELIVRENRLLSARIRRLHRNALLEMQQLRYYNQTIFLDRLDKYLTLRIKGESGAIDSLLWHVQTSHIEEEKPIVQRLRLEGENFFVDAEVLNMAEPSSLVPQYTPFSDIFDPLYSSRFTYAQMLNLINTLKSLSVGGANGVDVKSSELYSLLISAFHAQSSTANGFPIVGEQNLPVGWVAAAVEKQSNASSTSSLSSHASTTKPDLLLATPVGALNTTSVSNYFRSLVSLFAGPAAITSGNSVVPTFQRTYVDFRDLVLSIAMLDSISTPSLSQLLSMQNALKQLDGDDDGFVSWEEFSQLKLWFELGASGADEPSSPDAPAPADTHMESRKRSEEPVRRLKELFFHLFATARSNGNAGTVFLLSNIDFLLYLSFNDDDSTSGVGSDAAVSVSAPRSGLEKAQLLLNNVQLSNYGELTPGFVLRYIQQQNRSNIASTPAKVKFQRKDLIQAIH